MAQLADILVTLTLDSDKFKRELDAVGQELNNFRNRMRQISQNINNDLNNNTSSLTQNLQEISQSTQQSSNDVSNSSESMSNSINQVSTSSRTLARTLGTGLRDARRVLVASGREFQAFGGHGQRASYAIREQFSHLPRHLQNYVQRLTDAGQSTARFAQLNEQYGQRWVNQMRQGNDYMQNRTMQSTRLIQALRDQNMMPLSQQFLRIGQGMENAARRGSVLNLAISRLGTNAGPAQLRNEMQLISQGLGRMRGAFIGFGVVSLLALYGMGKLAASIDDRVVPAFERFKETWVDAFMPWITAFASAMVAVLNFGSAVNNLIGKFSSANPLLFKMIGGILLLTAVFGTFLAPLAVGIGLTGGLSASFAVLWAMIAPFVLGMLTVAGVAILVAAAVVILWVSIKSLWQNSEAFREAFISMWNGIKDAVINGFVTPVVTAWETLKAAFANLVHAISGNQVHSIGEFWKWLGDIFAIVVNAIAGVLLPILQAAFTVLGAVVVGIINGLVAVLNWLTAQWAVHGATITATIQMVWGYVQQAFTAISSFIATIMPSIMTTISMVWNFVKQATAFAMKYIAPIVVAAFKIIWEIIKFVMPWILNIIKSVWNNIKNVITSAIAIIQGVIKLFSSILKGDWKGAWEAVKSILKNAVILIWNLIQLYFIGKMLKIFSGFWTAVKSGFTKGWAALKTATTSATTGIKNIATKAFEAVKNAINLKLTAAKTAANAAFNLMKTGASKAFNGIKSAATTIFNAVKTAITKPIETAKNVVLKIIDTIKGAFAGMSITIPKPKLPKVSVEMKTNGMGIKYPSFGVSWNAKGGIFNGASILGGGQGVGEAGAEAVLPIQHKRYMKPFASAVASHLGSGETKAVAGGDKYEIIFNQPVVIREDADIQRIVDEMEKRKKIEQRSKGVFAF